MVGARAQRQRREEREQLSRAGAKAGTEGGLAPLDSGLVGLREPGDVSGGERLICVVGAGGRGKHSAQAQLLGFALSGAPAQLSRTSPDIARPPLRDRPFPPLGVVEDKQ